MTKQDTAPVSTRTILLLSLRADVDPRTARRWLRGGTTKPRIGERLAIAAKTLGLVREEPRRDAA